MDGRNFHNMQKFCSHTHPSPFALLPRSRLPEAPAWIRLSFHFLSTEQFSLPYDISNRYFILLMFYLSII